MVRGRLVAQPGQPLPCVAQRLASDPFPGGNSEWMMDRSRWNRCLAAGQSRRRRDPLWELNFSVCPTHRTGFGSQCRQRMRSGIQVIGALFGSTDEKARQENPRLWSCPRRGAFRDHGGQVLAAIAPWMQVRDGAVVFDAEVENSTVRVSDMRGLAITGLPPDWRSGSRRSLC